ncbi:DUF2586 domain-containing protein [Pragia fontium]|uniref:Phage tail protein n=1 Tax=Pragia fontium DSM 5563 = ATCC 49100 TaxID=1122977 RepID=A0AAJ5BGM3_9GAMM|nr:DUF2586 domain-containing protein [Pragia fontium]SFC49672.1 Protein of unknown function [Pragia fontium DSM 5563 = ATCC 49100]
MAFPEVTINQVNLGQGENKEVERTLLFIGVATDGTPDSNIGNVIPVNTQTDFDSLTGEGALKSDLLSAVVNAGQNWFAYVYILPKESGIPAAIEAIKAIQSKIQVEGVVSTIPVSTKAEIEQFNSLRSVVVSKFGTWQWFMLPVDGANAGENWAAVYKRLDTLQKGVAAAGVMLVPRLFGNEVGALAGRLCNRSVTIADSPMRVETGPMLDLGSADKPVDADGAELGLETLIALERVRYSVPAWYTNFDGVYWSDGRTLDAEAGDFQAIENLRVIDKMSRRIRVKAIRRIGNRALNSTPGSIERNKIYFAAVMREMSKSVLINGVQFPGELKPPKDGDIQIVWKTKTNVEIYAVGRTEECPKGITASIMLDLKLEDK